MRYDAELRAFGPRGVMSLPKLAERGSAKYPARETRESRACAIARGQRPIIAWSMKTPRFNNEDRPGTRSPFSPLRYPHPKWIRTSAIGDRLRRDSMRRKIFAIVAPPAPSDSAGNPVRRILIFDNHPDSLRLVSKQHPNSDVDLAALRNTNGSHVLLGVVLILTLLLGMLWPLI